jgi:hypothetical protein
MVCKTSTCELSHSSIIQIASYLFLLVFSIALAGIGFFARSIHIAQIDNQQSGGVVTIRV